MGDFKMCFDGVMREKGVDEPVVQISALRTTELVTRLVRPDSERSDDEHDGKRIERRVTREPAEPVPPETGHEEGGGGENEEGERTKSGCIKERQ